MSTLSDLPRTRAAALLLATVAAPLHAAGPADAVTLQSLLREARSAHFSPASSQELEQAGSTFAHWFAGSSAPRPVATLELLSLPPVQVLREHADMRQGRGLFALRPQAASAVLVQAPHQYHDRGTGQLARQLFEQGALRAASWNTAHRYLSRGSDLAHSPASYLLAHSLAFAHQYPGGLILQLHGFAARDERQGVDAIVSSGSRSPSPAARQLNQCLQQRLQIAARLYPEQIAQLGGTGNRIGAALRQAGFAGFVHLEMSRELRRRLQHDADARAQLLDCLKEIAR